MSLFRRNAQRKNWCYPYEMITVTRWRAWTKVLLTLVILTVIGTGAIVATLYGTHTWQRYGCFTVNYVDLRGGYAPDPSLYTTMGRIDNEGDQTISMGEIGKWHAGDSYCGMITYGVGQFDPEVLFGPTVNTKHELPNTNVPVGT